MKGQSYVIFAIIFMIVVAVFAVTNVDVVEVNYLFWSGEAPLIFVILFSVLMGGIITAAVGVVRMFRLQRQIRLLKAENKEMSKLLQENGITDETNREMKQRDNETGSGEDNQHDKGN